MTHRILLADDSATIRKVVELTFSDEDFAIDSVGDGSQAIEHARAQRPDIIISDVIMPGLNGYELCQQCKADPDLKSVPFLFLKGTFESFDEDKARSCGADGFIVKPFESQEMIAKVRDLIGRGAAAPAPVATQPLPIPATVQPTAPRPVPPQRPATAPPPIPTVQPRPAPPAVPVRPAPPTPEWPTRPVPVAPLSEPPPLQPTPPFHQPPPPPPAPPAPPPPPPPPAAVQEAGDEYGFDFGDAEDDRFGAPAPDTSGESDEDLWSEVSLSSGSSDLLDDRGQAESGVESGADIVDLSEESALLAPEVLFEDEAVFEEVSAARVNPPAPVVEAPETPEQTPATTASLPAAASGPAAPIAIDQDEIERLVSTRVEAAVRQILEPIVGDLARTMIESIAWEVIPDLAEAMIRAEIERVRQSTRTD